MRPAHCAREVLYHLKRDFGGAGTFNEARALCAGSSPVTSISPGSRQAFNEARALCAGS